MSAPITGEEIALLRALERAAARSDDRGFTRAAAEYATAAMNALPRLLDALEKERADRADTARMLVELERLRSLHLVSDEPSVGDSYTNGAIVKRIVSYSPADDHFQWHDGKRISRSILISDPMWKKL